MFIHIFTLTRRTGIDVIGLAFVGAGLVLTAMAVLAFTRINRQRRALLREQDEKGERLPTEELKRLGDRAPDFEYML